MLRDDLEIALNDLIIALREAADAYQTAAQIIGDADRAASFTAASDSHRDLAASLEAAQGSLGYLPKEPDSEKGLVRDMATHLRAALADDEVALLLNERCDDEARIVSCGEALLQLCPPEKLAALARRAIDHAGGQRRKLAAMTATPNGGV